MYGQVVGDEHERVVSVHDPATDLRAIVAVHSTRLGPALGGLRIRRYATRDEAMADVLALSAAMTVKAAGAGLDLGGGKAVILDDGRMDEPDVRAARLHALADVLTELRGRYITAEDIGTTTADMDLLGHWTAHVVGRSEVHGGVGDPSDATALTVEGSLRAGLRAVYGDDDPRGRRIGVIGLGKVGGALAARLCADGAEVVACDAMPGRAEQFAARHGLAVAPGGAAGILGMDLDVVAPCATGQMIDHAVATDLRCRLVAGAANNQLADASIERVLHQRGILHVPDELANAGGLIKVDCERRGVGIAGLPAALEAAIARTADVLLTAAADGHPPREVLDERVAARLAAAAPGSRPAGLAAA